MMKTPPKMKIVATILAKDEEDIIGQTIEHHINQGVTQFIVTDNRSTDRTYEIAAKYPEVVEIIQDDNEEHRQSEAVSRMARLACKLKPDWIVHLDADELWCGLQNLRHINGEVAGCVSMYLHPPLQQLEPFSVDGMRYYLDFCDYTDYGLLPTECKVAHRPIKDVVVSHGNHSVDGKQSSFTDTVWRHHYPIRSYEQFEKKAVQGNLALNRRKAPCARWEMWYDLWKQGKLGALYETLTRAWSKFIDKPNHADLMKLLEAWCTREVIEYFRASPTYLPEVGEWPYHEKQGLHH